jgi:hypothetical protein
VRQGLESINHQELREKNLLSESTKFVAFELQARLAHPFSSRLS